MSSLKEYDLIADRIRLHQQVSKNPAVVIEGVSDERFCKRVLPFAVDSFIATSRNNVFAVASDLKRLNLPRVACIVDRDFDDIVVEAVDVGLPVVAYDSADLEAMLLFTGAFEAMLREIGSAEKVRDKGGEDEVRSLVVQATRPLASLRHSSASNRWGLSFDSVELADRLESGLTIKIQSYCDALYYASVGRRSGVSRSDVYAACLNADLRCPDSGLPLIRGRDCLAILGVALRRQIGSMRRDQTTPTLLGAVLRLSATAPLVAHTAWFRALSAKLGY